MSQSEARWWGDFELDVGQCSFWQVGPLCLWIERLADEWRITSSRMGDPLDPTVVIASGDSPPPDTDADVMRFGAPLAHSRLTLEPALSDRAVVIRPDTPLFLLPGEEVRLHVGTPVWVRIAVGPSRRKLVEIPTFRLSDTFFGPNTREGELCYASRTRARLQLADVPKRRTRAATQLLVENKASVALALARLKIPVPRLSLYSDAADTLWTSTMHVVREADGQIARLELGDGPPPEAGDVTPVAPPRQIPESNLLARAVSALLG